MADPIKALTVPYRAGERIVCAGEAGVCLFLVQSGEVKLSRPAPDGREPVEIGVLEKGDIFGERSVLDGKPYGVDAVAVGECQVLELGALTFEKMLKAHPEIGVRLLRQLAARVDRLEQRIVETVAAPAPAAADAEPQPAPQAETPVAEVPTPRDGVPVPGEREEASPAPAAAEPPRERSRRSTTGERPARVARASRMVQEDGPAVFALGGTEMLIGRYDPVTETQPEIDLGPLDTKRSVSRRHARLTQRDGSWYVAEESGALNGTFVNGIKLLPGRGAPLADGDVVSLGMVRLVFREG